MAVCVHLLSAQNTGQKDTAVAESPTSNIEEHGLISGGSGASVAASNPHGPHTITWANTHTHTQAAYIAFPHKTLNRRSTQSSRSTSVEITFLSRLDATKYLLSGLQSHDQMILVCTAVDFPVCTCRENGGSARIRQQKRLDGDERNPNSKPQHQTHHAK